MANQIAKLVYQINPSRITDSNGNPISSNNGALDVNVINSGGAGTVLNEYAETIAVPSGVTTTLMAYTIPAATNAILEKVFVSGENIAKYEVLLNSSVIDVKRTYFTYYNETFDFTSINGRGQTLNPADNVTITVYHTRPYVGNFDCRLQLVILP